ncbi:hypothetical protein ACI782_02100 [Geodermatophilus sp. SYSU D00703]
MLRGTWAAPAACVLAIGGATKLLCAFFLPETRPVTLVGGAGLVAGALVLLALALGLSARLRRRGRPVADRGLSGRAFPT